MSKAAGVLRINDIYPYQRLDKQFIRRDYYQENNETRRKGVYYNRYKQNEDKDKDKDKNKDNENDSILAITERLRVNEPAIASPRG